MNVDYIRIDGHTPAISRHEKVQEFQTDPNVRVALLSLTAAGAGLNLTAASMVLFAELFWNPGVLNSLCSFLLTLTDYSSSRRQSS